MTAPIEEPLFLTPSRYCSKNSADTRSGQKNGLRPTSSQSQRSRSMLCGPICTGLRGLYHAGQNLDLVKFLTLRGEAGLAGPAAIEIALDIFSHQGTQRRPAVDHAADRDPVALAEGGDTE